jgi:hypothetical protein
MHRWYTEHTVLQQTGIRQAGWQVLGKTSSQSVHLVVVSVQRNKHYSTDNVTCNSFITLLMVTTVIAKSKMTVHTFKTYIPHRLSNMLLKQIRFTIIYTASNAIVNVANSVFQVRTMFPRSNLALI